MRLALIGTGMVADTHVAAIRDAGLTLACVMGQNPARTQNFAQKAQAALGYPIATTTDLAEITGDPTLDFVIIATPPDVRLDLIAPLAAAGKPILLEKPVARSLEEAEAVVRVCEEAGAPLGIVLQLRMRAEVAARKLATSARILSCRTMPKGTPASSQTRTTASASSNDRAT
ncbi:MAG: Gfo/Idh/MocA family oxidoreductase, partial [Pseudomonadota bacterium]